MYNQVLHAWSASGLPEAAERMESLLQVMRKDHNDGFEATPNNISYNILLRFHSKSVNKIDAILDTMQKERIQPDEVGAAAALYAYAKANMVAKAERMMHMLGIRINRTDAIHRRLLGESILHILSAYRKVIVSEPKHSERHVDAIRDAIAFYDHAIQKYGAIVDQNTISECMCVFCS